MKREMSQEITRHNKKCQETTRKFQFDHLTTDEPSRCGGVNFTYVHTDSDYQVTSTAGWCDCSNSVLDYLYCHVIFALFT